MTDKLMKKTTLYSTVFISLSLCVIVFFSVNSTIELPGKSKENIIDTMYNASTIESGEAEEEQTVNLVNELLFEESGQSSEFLCIPLPKEVTEEDILIENHYMDSMLCIVLSNTSADFYKSNTLGGNRSSIISGKFDEAENGVILKLSMNGLYEYRTILENNTLYIEFMSPREVYEKIVVIDPLCGGKNEGASTEGLSEKDIALRVAKSLKSRLDETDIKVYYTRLDDVNPSDAKRIGIANASKADMYIGIGLESIEDQSVYGVTAFYNGDYFIPGFGNVELSDILETELTKEVKGKALGLKQKKEGDFTLTYSKVPACILRVGFLSNKQESELLSREDYIEKIAEGIYQGILKSFESARQ